MDVTEAIARRRAYRSLAPVEITPELLEDLARHAQLAPSCFNNQPWRFVFVYEPDMLTKMREVMSKGNEWTFAASLVVAVVSKPDLDCVIHDREYYQFDCGQAVAFLILRAAELGLVAHPVAGYSPKKAREVLGVPDEYKIITLVNVGKHADTLNPVMSEKQVEDEGRRPPRKPFAEFVFHNRWPAPADGDTETR